MENDVYVRLLNEGTKVYRPVPANKVENNIYHLEGAEIYDSEDETWEFPPDTNVIVEERNLDGEIVLVAIRDR